MLLVTDLDGTLCSWVDFIVPALDAMVNGAHFGDVLDVLLTLRPQESAVADAGAMLGRWLKETAAQLPTPNK
mgnify:CR=1 FL=1